MNLYAVRLVENKEAVGFFWTESVASLWLQVDGVTDPGLCEYRPIRQECAIIYPLSGAPTLGAKVRDIDNATTEETAEYEALKNVTFDGAFLDYVTDEVHTWWHTFPETMPQETFNLLANSHL